MGTDQIMYCIVALLLGMLLANMLKSVCGCNDVVEGGGLGMPVGKFDLDTGASFAAEHPNPYGQYTGPKPERIPLTGEDGDFYLHTKLLTESTADKQKYCGCNYRAGPCDTADKAYRNSYKRRLDLAEDDVRVVMPGYCEPDSFWEDHARRACQDHTDCCSEALGTKCRIPLGGFEKWCMTAEEIQADKDSSETHQWAVDLPGTCPTHDFTLNPAPNHSDGGNCLVINAINDGGIVQGYNDAWCERNCTASNPNCPEEYCRCTVPDGCTESCPAYTTW